MILHDRAEVVVDREVQGEVRCASARKAASVIVSDYLAASFHEVRTTIFVEAPLLDAETGAPLGIDPETVTAFKQSGRFWSVIEAPVMRRQHGEDQYIMFSVQRGSATE